MADFVFTGTEVKRPIGGSNIQHGSPKFEGLWVHLKPIKLEGQTTKNRGGSITVGGTGPTFKFLAPLDLAENVTHTWEAYESVQSRLAEKVREVAKTTGEIKALGSSFSIDTAKNLASSTGVNSFMKNVVGGIEPTSVVKMKVDTPLVYTGSNRRNWVFSFNLVSEGIDKNNPSRDIVDVVQDLMKYSSPESVGSISINLPYIFDLSTSPNSFIKSSYTALTAVQPTYKGPYVKGYPSLCELTLSFTDLSPLFRKTIETGSLITVGGIKS